MKSLVALLFLFAGALRPAGADVGEGAWDALETGERPRLEWELLKGYRLFFHPDEKDALRRAITLAVPVEKKVRSVWALIKPLSPEPGFTEPWLRVEGGIDPGRLSIEWDGTYRDLHFKDGPYSFEVHVVWEGPPAQEQVFNLIVLKSLDYPQFFKVGSTEVARHPLAFKQGEFEPVEVSATLSKLQGRAAITARVLAPELPQAFSSTGLLVMGRRFEDASGKALRRPFWQCLCQQPLPADSPARLAARKVRCDWEVERYNAGTWDLRLGLYHGLKHAEKFGPCDAPLLDEDRLRVVLTP